MNRFFNTRKTSGIIFAVLMSFLLVFLITNAATTISTNISTDGTLTVTGASNFTGAVWATSTLQATGATTLYGTTTIVAKPLVLGLMATQPGGQAEGTIFYDSASKIIKLYDGSSWYTVATSSGGIVLSGDRLQFSTIGANFVTLGTTTPQGASIMTLEATSTLAIPLTLVARNSQSANTFQIRNSASANLLYINSSGGLFGSSTAQFDGALTTYGSDVLGDVVGDTLTINSGTIAHSSTLATTTVVNAKHNVFSIATSTSITPTFTISTISSPVGRVGIGTVAPNTTFEVVGTASTTNLVVGGDSTNGTLAGMIFGVCNFGNKTIAASSTVGVQCTATGVRTGDKVFVSATSSLHQDFIINSASSTAADTIGLYIFNTGRLGTTTTADVTGNTSINFFAIR